jgi:thymidine phosphorylase
MDAWRRMIAAQGGDPDAQLPVAPEQHVVNASADGVLTELDALAVGVAAWRLGAGRARKEDPVSAVAGVELHAKPGGTVRAGQPLLTLHTDDSSRFSRALDALTEATTITPADAPQYQPTALVIDRITA